MTVPGPLSIDQVVVRVRGSGKPSSLTVPLSAALPGRVTVWSAPAFTVGPVLTGGPV